ncbi:hypothetical protein E2562_032533 [Oryza meyeriana var. granulata]|uniref:DUF834 domain-containing protein n=1 Tax=Oryza meyeriana var. granulata TaxID=110450 RepID=A0A6G1DQG4_9ORYZ|nr:hypothetical protein E2562_032533 [Oryza meyeriana var. granulata]
MGMHRMASSDREVEKGKGWRLDLDEFGGAGGAAAEQAKPGRVVVERASLGRAAAERAAPGEVCGQQRCRHLHQVMDRATLKCSYSNGDL